MNLLDPIPHEVFQDVLLKFLPLNDCINFASVCSEFRKYVFGEDNDFSTHFTKMIHARLIQNSWILPNVKIVDKTKLTNKKSFVYLRNLRRDYIAIGRENVPIFCCDKKTTKYWDIFSTNSNIISS